MKLATAGIFAPQKLDAINQVSLLPTKPGCQTFISTPQSGTIRTKRKQRQYQTKKNVNDILETTKADEWEVVNLTEKIKLKCEPIGREEGSL